MQSLSGIIIDLFARKGYKQKHPQCIPDGIGEICEHDHCNCEEDGILKSSIKHTLNILLFIFIITLILNLAIYFVGQDNIANMISNRPILGPIISGIIGLIPNCAASVVLTQLYLSGVLNIAAMMSGILVNAGLGMLVLFRVNKNIKENIKIISIVYGIGVISGILIEAIGLNI